METIAWATLGTSQITLGVLVYTLTIVVLQVVSDDEKQLLRNATSRFGLGRPT